jgi:lysophospholipase
MAIWAWLSSSRPFLAEAAQPSFAAAPLFAEVADGPENGSAAWVMAADGVRIRVGLWGMDASRGTVFLFPGRTEYVEKYGRTARDLKERGFATLVVDWRGQGLAQRFLPESQLGHVENFTDYQKDVAAVVAYARASNLPKPWFLLAHSMGGCIALRALIEGFPVQAVAMTSPMWGILITPPFMRAVAWTLSTMARPVGLGPRLAPTKTLEPYLLNVGFDGNDLTTDADMWDYMKQQVAAQPELRLGGPTLQWLNEALRELRYLARIPSPAIPCLTFAGTEESIVEPGPIRVRMAQWPKGRLEIKQGSSHEILMEHPDTRKDVMDLIAAHFTA